MEGTQPSIDGINEIHFVNPEYIKYSEPSFQMLLVRILKDSLKKMKPPYTKDSLDKTISSVVKETRLKNFITLLSVESSKYKIVVGENRLDSWQSPFFMINQDSIYYLKPLRIKYDLTSR